MKQTFIATMQRCLLFCVCCFVMLMSVTAQDQTTDSAAAAPSPYFGYISYNSVYAQMPEYAQAQADFAVLKAKYEDEAIRAEKEFQQKFADYLTGQKDFPETIMMKRQAELQDLMEKSVAFRQQSQRLLDEAETKLQAPVAERLNAVIQTIAAQRGLHFVLNTDGHATPYLNPALGLDITPLVLELLKQE